MRAMHPPPTSSEPVFDAAESYALEQDRLDPLAPLRERFAVPRDERGEPKLYFCGNSLGLLPTAARGLVRSDASVRASAVVQASRPMRKWPRMFQNRASARHIRNALSAPPSTEGHRSSALSRFS